MYCPTCGTAEQRGRFCSECGAQLPAAVPAAASFGGVTDEAPPVRHDQSAADRPDVERVLPKTPALEGSPPTEAFSSYDSGGARPRIPTLFSSPKTVVGAAFLIVAVAIAVVALRASGPSMSSAELERRMTVAIAAEGFDSFVNCPDGEYKEGDVVVCEALLPDGLRQRFDATFHEENGELRPEVGIPDP